MKQEESALLSAEIPIFRAEEISAQQSLFRADSLEQRWSALKISILNSADSEKFRADYRSSALKKAKSVKQRCSQLNISGTPTRQPIYLHNY